ncbi:MAG: hypothetical protein IPL79_07445 [Myxococcales bacterium]|nr:hypothetical protein [Myxococcales bacterium]
MTTVKISSFIAALTVLATSIATGDPLPNGGEVVFEQILIREGGGDLEIPTDDDATARYFNKAHCVCGQSDAGEEKTFGIELKLEGSTSDLNRPAEIWYGSECDNNDQRATTCSRDDDAGIADIDTLALESVVKELSLFRLMEPTEATCSDDVQNSGIWVLVDSDADGSIDYASSATITTDSQPPPIPTLTAAQGAESAIELSWTAPTERFEDIHIYQALCVKPDGDAAFATAPAAEFTTVRSLCELNLNEVGLTAVTLGDEEPDPVPPPVEALAQLKETHVCGTATASATSMRIEKLENGVAYQVALVAIDKAGNAAGVYVTDAVTPVPATDFWEDLHDRGSGVEGGVCLIAQVYGGDGGIANGLRAFRDETLASTALGRWLTARYYAAFGKASWASQPAVQVLLGVALLPLVAMALLWHWLGWLCVLLAALPWLARNYLTAATWQRLKVRLLRPAVALGVLILALAASPAFAQSNNEPYWASDEGSEDYDDPSIDPVTWRVGLKVGPYVPGIDAQLGDEPGPYESMFGTGGVMPVLDVERIIFRRAGHVAIAGNIGFFSTTANAWRQGSSPTDPDRPRASSDSNSFRLMPMSIGVSYRLTQLHEQWKIPLVPYARGGVAYYLWWIKAPNGDVARIEGADDKALGASLGVVGAVGISLRLDWIDKDAMQSMRESGTQHAGLYAEIQGGKVDGFGSEKKLSVGDTTWFAGVDFEF